MSTDDGGRLTAAPGGEAEVSGSAVPSADPSAGPGVEPDLLWIESVTERLLGGAGRPASWERSNRHLSDPPAAESSGTTSSGTTAEPRTAPNPPAGPSHGEPLPRRRTLPHEGTLRYDEATVGRRPEPEPEPYFESATPSRQGPPTRAEMPPAVLRAALRDAVPDDLGRRPSPVDAVFGDPRWQLPPEPDEPSEPADLGDDPLFAPWHPTAAAAAQPGTGPRPSAETIRTAAAPRADPTVDLTAPELAPTAPSPPESESQPQSESVSEPGSHRRRVADDDAATVALRRAFLSGDAGLGAAVIELVGLQAAGQHRLRLVQAYLDALLSAGDEGFAGATKLRRLLDD